ncbi:MAG: PAS domain S-box protein [Kiritimatiellales bacterium]|nr:PAS domain S-box protein [Kiritimatiellota bacterium]MBL7011760.1 PAS domain S-box protein [Kiritimatiellales bacterium]
MKKSIRILLLFFLVFGSGLSFSQTLRSAAEPNYPPFSIVNPDGSADGFAVELLRAALSEVNRKASFQTAPWNQIKNELAADELDVLPLVGRTPEREVLFDFTFPYLTLHGALFVRNDETAIQSLSDLPGKKIAVMTGDNAEEYVLRAKLSDQIISTTTFEEAFNLLSSGEADAVIAQKLMGVSLLKQLDIRNIKVVGKPNEEFKQDFCFAVTEGNAELLAELNEGLAIVVASGTHRRLMNKWLGAGEAIAARSRVLLYGDDPTYPPYMFLDEQGQPAGFHVELLQAIAEKTGIEIAFRPDPWSEVQRKMMDGELDITSMLYTPERDQVLDFSLPHSVMYASVFTRTGAPSYAAADLKGHRIAVQKGDMLNEYALAQGWGDTLTVAESEEESLALLADRKVDFVLGYHIPGLYWIHKNGWDNIREAEPRLMKAEYCFAVQKGDSELLHLLDNGLRQLQETGEYKTIYNKWLGAFDDTPRPLPVWFWTIAYGIGSATILLFGINRLLKHQIEKRTAELRASEEMMRNSQSVAHICSYSTTLNVDEIEKSQWACSPEFYKIFGIDETYPHTIESWAGFIHPDFLDEVTACHESVIKEKTSFDKEYKIIRIDDGAERWVHGTGELEFDKEGTPIRMHGAIQDITERKQAQQELEESRQLLHNIIDTIPDRVWWKDLDSRYLGCNIHVAQDAGLDHPDQLIGKTDFDMIWADEAERFIANDRSVIESGMPRFTDDRLQVLADGTTRWINVSQFPLKDTNGEIIGTLSTYIDVTERNQAQQAVEEARQLLSNIIDTMPQRVWWKDLNSRYMGCNILVAQDAGFDHPDQLIGKTDFDMPWAEHAETFIASDREVIESGEPRLYEPERQVLEDGSIRWIEVSIVPLKDTAGKIFGVMGAYADITDRKLAQLALEESRQLLYNIIDTLPNRVWWKDLDSRYIGCNILVAQDAGLDHPDQMIGKTDFDMPWAEQAEAFIANDRKVIESGMPRLYDDECQVLPDGSTRWINVSQFPLKDTTGKIIGTLNTYADITERKRMQEAIEKQILALTRPLEGGEDITFEQLFNLKDIQRIQDEFSDATGTAALILRPDGTPITEPSNFIDLCKLIRATEKGCAKCLKSDKAIGARHPGGPLIQPCMSAGLWDAGSNIMVGGKHIASWLIGQVRDETQTEDQMRAYAREIDMDETVFIEAFRNVPAMPREKFEKIAQALSTLANQLSTSAYQNMQQARFISDQKKTEQSLRESEERFKSLHDASFGGIAIHDNGIILECNHGLSIITGYSEEELIGMNGVTELIAEDSRDVVMDRIQAGDEKPYEATGLRKNGETYPVRVEARNVLYKGKRVRTVEFRDITERKKTEEELRRLSTAIEQSPETVMITDIKGTIQYVNPAFTTITGYTREEALGQNPRILKSRAHDEAFYAAMWKRLLAGQIWEGRIVNKRKDGSLFTEEASFAPVKDPNGDVTNFVAVKRDITKELLREEQMQQVQKMEAVGQLAGGIAHDFNNILQAILGFSELLLMTLDERAEQPRNNVLEIQKAAQHAADLTRQLLAFSRKQNVDFKPVNLNDAIRNTLSFAKSIIGEAIEIKTDLEPKLNLVEADSRQMERTILNLVLNARDAMPQGGVLTLKTENICFLAEDATASIQEGEFACLIISDTGTGIQSDIIEHIFEPFFSTKPPGQGTGLGLAAIYGIIQDHKGWIDVYSEPGRGTTFKMYLPTHRCRSPREATKPARHETGHGERILVVENDAATQILSKNTLQKAGYVVTVTSTAEEAEILFDKENGRFDLLFSDVILPGKTGTDLAAALLQKNLNLKVLLCSGHPVNRIKSSTVGRNNLFFLEKPFSIVNLLHLVNQILKG